MDRRTPPLPPSDLPAIFCAECGSEVVAAASLCATCGKSLDEPGAIASTHPFSPATSRNAKQARGTFEKLFPVLLALGFVVVYEAVDPKNPLGWGLVLPAVAFLFYLWADGSLDKR